MGGNLPFVGLVVLVIAFDSLVRIDERACLTSAEEKGKQKVWGERGGIYTLLPPYCNKYQHTHQVRNDHIRLPQSICPPRKSLCETPSLL